MPEQAPKRLRACPRFEIPLSTAEGERLLAELARSLRGPNPVVRGRMLPKHAELTTCARRTHVWSPRLMLYVESADDGSESVRGRFCPHPNVWTGFLAIYAVLGMGAMFAAMFGISQYMLDQTPWSLWGVPAALALIGFTYGAGFIGQGLGAEEMYVLRSFVDQALRNARAHDTASN
ncbi:MAG TPA: hypothetical protein VI299_24350 [Polyangiales bacterium]